MAYIGQPDLDLWPACSILAVISSVVFVYIGAQIIIILIFYLSTDL